MSRKVILTLAVAATVPLPLLQLPARVTLTALAAVAAAAAAPSAPVVSPAPITSRALTTSRVFTSRVTQAITSASTSITTTGRSAMASGSKTSTLPTRWTYPPQPFPAHARALPRTTRRPGSWCLPTSAPKKSASAPVDNTADATQAPTTLPACRTGSGCDGNSVELARPHLSGLPGSQPTDSRAGSREELTTNHTWNDRRPRTPPRAAYFADDLRASHVRRLPLFHENTGRPSGPILPLKAI